MSRFEKMWERTRPERLGPGLEDSLKKGMRAVWNQALIELAQDIIEDDDRPEQFGLAAEAYLTKKIRKLRTDLEQK